MKPENLIDQQLASLIGSMETPPAPSIDVIVKRATAHSQVPPVLTLRPVTYQGWVGRNRWYAFAFASCLVVGVAFGFVSAQSQDLPNSVYNLIDGSGIGESYD